MALRIQCVADGSHPDRRDVEALGTHCRGRPGHGGARPSHPAEVALLSLQHMAGNAAVGQLLEHAAGRPPVVQRCGTGPCGCSEEERAAHEGAGTARMAVQRACGSREIGSHPDCDPAGGDLPSGARPFLFSVNCDTFAAGQEELLRSKVGPGDRVVVHGFASVEGRPGYNRDLSCARAERAAGVLSDIGAVVESIRRHGATPGERISRRSVVVEIEDDIIDPSRQSEENSDDSSGPECSCESDEPGESSQDGSDVSEQSRGAANREGDEPDAVQVLADSGGARQVIQRGDAEEAAAARTRPFAKKHKRAQGAPCSVEARACFSVSRKKAWLIEKGKAIYSADALGGEKGKGVTPIGVHYVTWKNKKAYSQKHRAQMPWAVFFVRAKVAFHQGNLSVTSHGCVHLSPKDAEKFYNTLKRGDRVEVVK